MHMSIAPINLDIPNYQIPQLPYPESGAALLFLTAKQNWRRIALTFSSKFKRYVTLNVFPRKNNCFAVITKKLYEIPKLLKHVGQFLIDIKTRIKHSLTKHQKKGSQNIQLSITQDKRRQDQKLIKQKHYTLAYYFNTRFFLVQRNLFTRIQHTGQYFFEKYIAHKSIIEEKTQVIRAALLFKIKKKMKFWFYGANKPGLPRKRWQRLLKQQKYNRKKLFRVIRRNKLFKKKVSFRSVLLQKRQYKTINVIKSLKKHVHIMLFNQNKPQPYRVSFVRLFEYFIDQLLRFANSVSAVTPHSVHAINYHFLTLKRQL